MREDLAEPKSKEGMGQNLVPVSSEKLKKHVFKLEGRKTFQGHDSYRISFKPARARPTSTPTTLSLVSTPSWRENSAFTLCSFTAK
jgi:hypothetical protein